MTYIKLLLIMCLITGCSYTFNENNTFETIIEIKNISINSNKTNEGLNFFSERPENFVYLMRNNGEVVHKWNLTHTAPRLSYPFILNNGSLVYLDADSKTLGIIDNNSNLIWEINISVHHDAKIYNNNILTVVQNERYIESLNYSIIDENITLINISTGEIIFQSSLYDLLKKQINIDLKIKESMKFNSDKLNLIFYEPYNVFHNNGIYVLKKNYNDIFIKNRVLFSIRNINTIVLIDLESQELKWEFGSNILDGPHYPSLTPTGNLLIFDNGYVSRTNTRILEVDTNTKNIIWSYNDDGTKNFHSNVMGSAQYLNETNLLILESTKGRAFELKNEQIVWEYLSKDNQRIYRFERLDETCIYEVFYGQRLNSLECLN